MKSNSGSVPTLTLVMVCLWCCVLPPLAAQEEPLGKVELPPAAISVDLAEATLRIHLGETEHPELRWWRERAEQAGSAELSVSGDAATVSIERPAPAEGEDLARLLIEIVMPATHPVRITGSGLDLNIEREEVEESQQTDLEEEKVKEERTILPQTPVEIHLAASRASLAGIGPVTAVLDGCVVDVRRTKGLHRWQVHGGELRVVGHAGTLVLTTQDADVVVEDSKGQTTLQGTGGSMGLTSSRGRFNLQADGTQLQVLGWEGAGMASATDSNVDLRDSRFQSLSLKVVSSHASVSNSTGTTSADLTGGSLVIDGLEGKFTGGARESASIDLSDHQGDVVLNLGLDASADVTDVSGGLTVNSQGADLTVDGASRLALTANESWVTLSRIARIGSFQATHSEIDLDLSESTDRNPKIAVQAESYVRVQLSTPCRVTAKGVVASLASQVDVTGCEFQAGQGRKWATKNVRGIDGRPPITLTAQVAADAELVVEGRP